MLSLKQRTKIRAVDQGGRAMLPEYEQRGKSALPLVVASSVLILSVCFAIRRREVSQLLTAAPHRRIILVDDVDHLPPLAWKAIPMTLPSSGIVNIDVRVIRGNPIDAFLTTPDQFDIPKKVEWNGLKIYRDISITGTRTFRWTGRLEQGGFYLVVRDMTVPIPTTPTSDISVKVLLDP